MSFKLTPILQHLESKLTHTKWEKHTGLSVIEYLVVDKSDRKFIIALNVNQQNNTLVNIRIGNIHDFDTLAFKDVVEDMEIISFIDIALMNTWRRKRYFFQAKHFKSEFLINESQKVFSRKIFRGVSYKKQFNFWATSTFELGLNAVSSLVVEEDVIPPIITE